MSCRALGAALRASSARRSGRRAANDLADAAHALRVGARCIGMTPRSCSTPSAAMVGAAHAVARDRQSPASAGASARAPPRPSRRCSAIGVTPNGTVGFVDEASMFGVAGEVAAGPARGRRRSPRCGRRGSCGPSITPQRVVHRQRTRSARRCGSPAARRTASATSRRGVERPGLRADVLVDLETAAAGAQRRLQRLGRARGAARPAARR